MLIPVLLYGHLAKLFGKRHFFDVASPAEAVRALSANFKGFQQALCDYKPGYHVFRGKENIGADQVAHPSGRDSIRIVPVIAGAKRGGIFQIIIGAILVAAGIYFEQPWLIQMGASMILGGVAQLLFAPPLPKGPQEKEPNRPSYAFNGAVNTTAQGHPVPVGYGRLRVGSAVISGGIFVSQIDQNGVGSIGTMRVGPVLSGVPS